MGPFTDGSFHIFWNVYFEIFFILPHKRHLTVHFTVHHDLHTSNLIARLCQTSPSTNLISMIALVSSTFSTFPFFHFHCPLLICVHLYFIHWFIFGYASWQADFAGTCLFLLDLHAATLEGDIMNVLVFTFMNIPPPATGESWFLDFRTRDDQV